jgi:hypothetical protein
MGEVVTFPLTNHRQHAESCRWHETEQPWDCSCGAIKNPQTFLETKTRVEEWEKGEMLTRRAEREAAE